MNRRFYIGIVLAVAYLIASLCVIGAVIAQTARLSVLDKIEQLQQQQTSGQVEAEKKYGELRADLRVLQNEVSAMKANIEMIRSFGGWIVGTVIIQVLLFLSRWIFERRKEVDRPN
jgi:peptidoglycan hydrolase CwlO-like protein